MIERNESALLYRESLAYLSEMAPSEVNLSWYFIPQQSDYTTLQQVFDRMIGSAQNSQSMPSVIGYWGTRRRKILAILSGEPDAPDADLEGIDIAIVAEWTDDELYGMFCEAGFPSRPESKRNLWRRWSKSVVDCARFLAQFPDVEAFRSFADMFQTDEIQEGLRPYMRLALPLTIEQKIRGMGFALACDFLKEVGYENYPKPDVHLGDVFCGLGFTDDVSDYGIYESIVRAAELASEATGEEVTPYKLDKIIWLICTGTFYGGAGEPSAKVAGRKEDFVRHMKARLSEAQ